MDKKQIACGRKLVNLLAEGLGCSSCAPIAADADITELLEMARNHELLVMAVHTLKQSDHFRDDPRLDAWSQAVQDSVWQGRVQHLELMNLCNRFALAQIPMMPLKGSFLKTLYPRTEYRQMCDLDLLVPEDRIPQARELLTAAGYALEEIGEFHRDIFVKLPFMEIELHSRLLPDKEVSAKMFEGLWDRAKAPEQGNTGWRMSNEDFYVFLILHFAKHYKFRGSGIRSILDLWLFLEKYGPELDQDKLSRIFADSGLSWFRETAEALADVWFGDGIHDRETRKMELNLFCSGGIYGSDKQYMRNHLMWVGDIDRSADKLWTKIRFLMWRIFPPLRTMRIRYPILVRKPVLLPVYWIFRIGEAIFNSGRKTWKEIIGIWKA
jgi:hypothetical protein